MAIKFQYNKTSLTNLGKQLKVRQNALPTLKNKESALRSSVLEAKKESERLASELEASLKRYDYLAALWNEFDPGLVRIVDVDLRTVKVAGVKTPKLDEIHYEIRPFNAFVKPAWYADGVAILKIKRYMEDEENLSKASSKIVKSRHAAEEEEEQA